MNRKNDVVRERFDAVDETILLILQEGSRSLGNISTLAELNYNTCRQRLEKLIRYSYITKPKYGEYALSDKGRRFVEELALPVSPDLEDPKLKKLIDMLPTDLHRAFFRLMLSGIIAKHHLAGVYDDGYPAFILGGETKSFKTALAKVICRLLGLKPEENIYPLFSAVAGEFGIRRFRAKGEGFQVSSSLFFKQPFVCLDEFDKVTDRNTRRNVLFFLDGRSKFTVESETIENQTCAMVTLNTKIGRQNLDRFGIPEPYIRRSIVADTEHVRTELKEVDLAAKRVFEMKEFPRINLEKLRLAGNELPEGIFNLIRGLLLGCTDESSLGLVDTRPLVIMTLGRSALLGGDIREAAYQTTWDRLVCLESMGGTVMGWRETVAKEWARYKRDEQPEIARKLEEARQRDRERRAALSERASAIEEKKVERIEDQTAFILHRAELGMRVQKLVKELGRGEPLAEPLKWLRKKIDSCKTPEELSQYEASFNKSNLPKVNSRLQEKKDAEDQAKREAENAKWVASVLKDNERKQQLEKRQQQQAERRRAKDEVKKLRAEIRQLDYYLGRKYLKEGEDPVLILQQLKIIKPVEGSMPLRVLDKQVNGHWLRSRWTGQPYYVPPFHDFIDYDAVIQRWSEISNGRLYKWSQYVQGWTSWTNVWPLLLTKRAKYVHQLEQL